MEQRQKRLFNAQSFLVGRKPTLGFRHVQWAIPQTYDEGSLFIQVRALFKSFIFFS